jgi:hypothetical protein
MLRARPEKNIQRPMKFILYSDIDAASIRNSLGKPEYSYYFVLKAFQPVLEQLGAVELVRNPAEEVDPIFEACAARGEDCVFVSFSPPNVVTLDLKCPTIVVVAWEFSTIPDGGWDPANPREDWRYVFSQLGLAISLSNHTAKVVKQAMGGDFPIFAVASPVYDRIRRLPVPASGPVIAGCEIAIRGAVFDSRDFELSPEQILEPIFPPLPIRPTAWEQAVAARARQDELAAIERARVAEEARAREAEAAQLRAEEAARLLAAEEARAAAYRRSFRFRLAVTKRHLLEWYREAVRDLLPRPLARIIGRIGGLAEAAYRRLTGWKPPAPPEVVQPPPPPLDPLPPPPPEVQVSLGGVVYTSLLNPTDGRKNWHDLLTAFLWVFQNVEDATLVLKIIKGDPNAYRRDLFLIMARSGPFKCRIVTMDGFLEDAEYGALMGATSFYVNTSNAEGMCMPLTEFMSVGKPVIAPRHTAMADYIDPSAAFVVESTPEHNVWPNDPRPLYTTMREKLKWDTLAAAFEESYRVAKQAPERYAEMGANAERIMRDYCSDHAVRERLRYIMGEVAGVVRRDEGAEPAPAAVAEAETA